MTVFGMIEEGLKEALAIALRENGKLPLRKLGHDADGKPLNIIEPWCGQCRIGENDTYCGCGKQPEVRTSE